VTTSGLRHHQRRLNLGDPASGGLHRRLLLATVQPEDRRPFGDRFAKVANIDLGDTSIGFRQDRDGSEEEGGVARRGVVVKDDRDEPHGQH
jgi:hypothetical protein